MRNISQVLPILCRSNISVATSFFFRCFRCLSRKGFFIRMRKKICIYIHIYIFLIIVSNSKTYINEIKAKSPLEKLIALCNIYIYIYKYFIFCFRSMYLPLLFPRFYFKLSNLIFFPRQT